ncbi:MAG: hypothetical protein Alpg2KO_21450 [Alphaproteobacteria bacterium]
MSPSTETFFSRHARTEHEGGARKTRRRTPLLKRLVTLGVIGFMALGIAAISPQPAQAQMTTTTISTSVASNVAAQQAAQQAAKKRKEARALGVERADLYIARDAATIQAQEQGHSRWSYGLRNTIEIDQERIQDFVEARKYEDAQRAAAETREDKWKFDAWQAQAAEQGLNGWSDDGFREDRTETSRYIQKAQEDHEAAVAFTRNALIGLGGLGLVLGGVHVASQRRRRDDRPGYRR